MFFRCDVVALTCDRNAMFVGSIPTRRNEILFIDILIPSLVTRSKRRVELRHRTRTYFIVLNVLGTLSNPLCFSCNVNITH